MAETQRWQALPAQLERTEFEQFVLPPLSIGSRRSGTEAESLQGLLRSGRPRELPPPASTALI
jgi:hypothetical protein